MIGGSRVAGQELRDWLREHAGWGLPGYLATESKQHTNSKHRVDQSACVCLMLFAIRLFGVVHRSEVTACSVFWGATVCATRSAFIRIILFNFSFSGCGYPSRLIFKKRVPGGYRRGH